MWGSLYSYSASNSRMINKLSRKDVGRVIVHFMVLTCHLPGQTKENKRILGRRIAGVLAKI
jgi:hypothetical protein